MYQNSLEENLEILKTYRHDPRYIGLRNYKTDHSLFGLKFAYETMSNELNPFDYDTFYKSHTKVLVGVTNANTGKAGYIDGHKIDRHCTVLKATCAIPIVFPAIKIGENEYFDGGIADSIPVKKAIEDGNKKLLIVLTRPKGYKKNTQFLQLNLQRRLCLVNTRFLKMPCFHVILIIMKH